MNVTVYNTASPQIKEVPLKAILEQHRKRYVLHTHIGDVVMRHVRLLEMQETTNEVMSADPEIRNSMVVLGPLFAKVKSKTKLLPVEEDALRKHNTRLLKITHALAVKCIESPKLETVDDFEALMVAMTAEERDEMYLLLGTMVQASQEGDVSASVALLAKEFNIPLTNDLTLETMTVEQAKALEGALEQRADAERRAVAGVMR